MARSSSRWGFRRSSAGAFGSSPPAGSSGSPRETDLRHRREALVERIPCPADGADRVGFAAAVDGLAQPADMHIHGALVDIDVVAPHAVEQLLARIDTAGVAHQIFEQPVFGWTQVQIAAGAADAMALAVEFE